MSSSFRRRVKIHRPAGDYDVDGLWQESGAQDKTIQASVQPVSGRDMHALPEGRRNRPAFYLFTDFALRTVDEQNPDRVTLEDGRLYEAISVEAWQNGVLPHFKALISRCEQVPDGVT